MLFRDVINNWAVKFKDININDADIRSTAKFYLNRATQAVYVAADWKFNKKTAQLTLIPNVVTGSCGATFFNGSNYSDSCAVTVSGVTLGEEHIGRYFQLKNSNHWHKIIYVDGSTIYLDSPIVDGSVEYGTIWKRFYYVKSSVFGILNMEKWSSNGTIDYASDAQFSSIGEDRGTTGDVYSFTPYGVDEFDDNVYNTGTVSGQKDTNVITADNGANGFGNVDSGDILIVNNFEYRIKRVETSTRWIISNYLTSDIPSGTVYEIRKDNPLGFTFYNNTDKYINVPYTYISRTYDMVNEDKDIFPMNEEFLDVVMARAEAMYLKDKDDSKWLGTLQLYDAMLNAQMQKKRGVTPKYMQFAPKIPRYMPGRGLR